MRIKTHLDTALYISSLQSDKAGAEELVTTKLTAGFLYLGNPVKARKVSGLSVGLFEQSFSDFLKINT